VAMGGGGEGTGLPPQGTATVAELNCEGGRTG
jgi:hypothetical protein